MGSMSAVLTPELAPARDRPSITSNTGLILGDTSALGRDVNLKLGSKTVLIVLFATLAMPFVKVFGTVTAILYDIHRDSNCKGRGCFMDAYLTGQDTYLTLIIGIVTIGVVHFAVGVYIFSKYPRLILRSFYAPMKIYGVFTGAEILTLTATLSTIHTTPVMALGYTLSVITEFLAMSAVFCYPLANPTGAAARRHALSPLPTATYVVEMTATTGRQYRREERSEE